MQLEQLLTDLEIFRAYGWYAKFSDDKIKVYLLDSVILHGLEEDDVSFLLSRGWVYNPEKGYWFYLED